MTDDTPRDPQPLTTDEIALIRKRHAAERAIDSRSVTEERLLATLDARPSGDEALRAAAQSVVLAAKKHTPEIIALNKALAAPVSQAPDDSRREAITDDRAWASGYAAGRAAERKAVSHA